VITIDGFLIDIAKTEDHGFDSEVTDHPVESGADITDHVRARPIKLVVDCVVSDTPIGEVAKVRGMAEAQSQMRAQLFSGVPGSGAAASARAGRLPSEDAFAHLLAIRDRREPVTVITERRTYPRMVLEGLTIPRTSSTGDALEFRATFKEVRLVTNERTTIPVAVPKAAKKRNFGSKPPTPVSTATGTAKVERDRSLLTQIKDRLF
jgi:hypothetical protein